MPAMVAMPELEIPLMEMAEIQQQLQQGHGVLSTRNGQQQLPSSREQRGLIQQMLVKAVVPSAPGHGQRLRTPTV